MLWKFKELTEILSQRIQGQAPKSRIVHNIFSDKRTIN